MCVDRGARGRGVEVCAVADVDVVLRGRTHHPRALQHHPLAQILLEGDLGRAHPLCEGPAGAGAETEDGQVEHPDEGDGTQVPGRPHKPHPEVKMTP